MIFNPCNIIDNCPTTVVAYFFQKGVLVSVDPAHLVVKPLKQGLSNVLNDPILD